jgi:TRAP-type transport system periplasmic protein
VTAAMDQVPQCVETSEAATLEEWRANNTIQIIEDVDREAFRTKAEAYLLENFSEEQVPVLEAIRSVATP